MKRKLRVQLLAIPGVELGTFGEAKLGSQIRRVLVHGLFADAQSIGNLAVSLLLGKKSEHLPLASGDGLGLRIDGRAGAAEFAEDLSDG